MATFVECFGCGRTFWSDDDNPYCWDCLAVTNRNADDAFVKWGSIGCFGLIIWFLVVVPAFTLMVLAVSIAPMAFGILAAYMVAVVTAESMPAVAAEALPSLVFLFCCFILRFLLFLRGRGKTGLMLLGIYFGIGLAAALALAYTGIRPMGFDAVSAGAGVPGLIGGRVWVFEYISFGKLDWLVAAYKGYTAYVAGFGPKLLAVSLVVYLFILPVEIVLFFIAWRKVKGRIWGERVRNVGTSGSSPEG